MTAKKIQDFSKGDLVEWNPGRFYYGTQSPGRHYNNNKPLGIVVDVYKCRRELADYRPFETWKLCVKWHTDHFVRVYKSSDEVELERITIAAKGK